jgi:hypothetical protein
MMKANGLPQQFAQSIMSEQISQRIGSFYNPVRIQEDSIIRLQSAGRIRVGRKIECSEDQAVLFDLCDSAIPQQEHRRVLCR